MAKFYVPGPTLIYATTGAGGAWQHVGWTERNVRVSSVPKYIGVSTDYSGLMDADVSFQGEELYVSARLNRFNESVLQLMKKRLNNTYATVPGTTLAGAIGTLLGLEECTYGLAIVSQYASKTVYSGDMIPGFHMAQAYLSEPDERELNAEVRVESLTWRSLPQFGAEKGSGGLCDGSYVLYTQADIASLDLPIPG